MKRAELIEFNVSSGEISRQLANNPIVLNGGYVEIPDRPGMGIEVNEAMIEKYRIA